MNIFVIGGGGREHALVFKLAQSPRVEKIFCAPGNAGIAKEATCVPIAADNINELLSFAKKEKIDLTIVGPELPLTLGITDIFQQNGLKIFGPSKDAAVLEGSKVFMKEFCLRHNIRTGAAKIFDDAKKASDYLSKASWPLVVKADGLAAGKGVIICKNIGEAKITLDDIMNKRIFGNAGNKIVFEEFLQGEEVSFLAISDGTHVLPLATSQDHKRIFDDDKGPNTGGMGAYSPAPMVTEKLYERIMNEIMLPTIEGMAAEGRKFVGVLYAGLMIKNNEPFVLEFNCRFGDPETQPIMMRLKSDLVNAIEAALNGTLDMIELDWDKRSAVCVVLSSGGYPGEYKKGDVISGLEDTKNLPDVKVFHAGTIQRGNECMTNGGRVLGVTASGADFSSAINNAYSAVKKISWNGMHYRKDIGRRAIR